MDHVLYMIDYFHLSPHLTKENLTSAFYVLYYYSVADSLGSETNYF